MERVIETGNALTPYILIKADDAETIADEIWERLAILLGTEPEEQALDRELCIRIPIDSLLPQACAETQAEIIIKVRRYIDGVYVKYVDWVPGGYNGQMTLKVVVARG